MKKIAILGSTGSIGTQTLEVARNNGDLEIVSLAAGSNIKKLEEQIREFHPEDWWQSGPRKRRKSCATQ